MLRKTITAAAAALTLGAAALAPNSASAWAGHPGWYGWHHGWFYRPAVRVYAGPILRRLYSPPLGVDALWPSSAMGQRLLLRRAIVRAIDLYN
jgi:hypothetical protein